MKNWLKKFSSCFREVVAHFFATEGFLSATALAYTTLLSLVPLMILSLGIFSIFPSFKEFILEANQFLFEHFVPTSAGQITKQVGVFAQTATEHSLTGFLFSLISSLILIYSLESAFNLIWQIKVRRPFFKALSTYCLALVFLPAIMGALLSVHIFLYSLPFLASLESFFGLLSLLLTWLIFLLLYTFLPHGPVKFYSAAVGAFVSAVLFMVLKQGFGIYIDYFSSFTIIYGALAAIPIFLTWLYLSWIVVLLGGVISFVLSKTNDPTQ